VFVFDFTSWCHPDSGGPRFYPEVEIYYQTVVFQPSSGGGIIYHSISLHTRIDLVYAPPTRRLTIPLTLKSSKVTQRKLTSPRSRLGAGLYVTALLVLLILPLASLAVHSVTRLDSRLALGDASPEFTLDYYRELGVNRRESAFYVPPYTAIGISWDNCTTIWH
jgi:thiamine transport system permease protein